MLQNSKDALIIFDTTLRDGEQSPGVSLTVAEKVEIAKQLSRLGVHVCEAGFPIASQGDFEAVSAIADTVGPLMIGRTQPMVICALARATQGDISRACIKNLKLVEAIKNAPRRRIHTFLATSDIHLEFKLKISKDECVKRAVAAVKFAKSLGVEVEFSPEDAGRSDPDFVVRVLEAVCEAGATTLNIPDTVGYNTPQEYGDLIKYLIENVHSPHPIVFSTHCHNDLGLATANSLAGICNGARQVEVTINGIGERAGNTSLEEIVMAIHTHPSSFPVFHCIDTYQIYNASQLVSRMTGMMVQPNKAIVGANAFAHESGIHQDGMLKNKSTYEIIQPEILGIPTKALFLGKHSGRAAFKSRMESLVKDSIYQDHISADPNAYEALFLSFKNLADSKKKGVNDQDLYALLDDYLNMHSSGTETFTFVSLQVFSGSGVLSTATVSIMEPGVDDSVKTDASIGQGPIHAIFGAINRLVGVTNVLAFYEVKAVTEGSDSLGKVFVRIQRSQDASPSPILELSNDELDCKQTIQGQGIHTDILVASAMAYINAINRMMNSEARAIGKKPFVSRFVSV